MSNLMIGKRARDTAIPVSNLMIGKRARDTAIPVSNLMIGKRARDTATQCCIETRNGWTQNLTSVIV